MRVEDLRIAVIGLGYVGLPLAVAFGKLRPVVGFDINSKKINELKRFIDVTGELESEQIESAENLNCTSDESQLRSCNCYIVTVPTPIDEYNRPDMSPLISASRIIGRNLDPGDLVIYESTVYPGATEGECAEVLSQESGLEYAARAAPKAKDVYHLGYSPERINPGDKTRTLQNIVKVTSGSSPNVTQTIDQLYGLIIDAGTHIAPSIKVAEAAKVIENIQRDVNIALINEFAMIFDRLEINTQSVLEASGTKWNFLNFRPGLVGGHCIGVDPFYLAHCSIKAGFHPEMILAGRRINDGMADYVAQRTVKLMLGTGINVLNAKVLVLGLTFKENCADIRNSKVFDLINSLAGFKCDVDVHDPNLMADVIPKTIKARFIEAPSLDSYDAIILAVAHDEFKELGVEKIRQFGKKHHVMFDMKYLFPNQSVDEQL